MPLVVEHRDHVWGAVFVTQFVDAGILHHVVFECGVQHMVGGFVEVAAAQFVRVQSD